MVQVIRTATLGIDVREFIDAEVDGVVYSDEQYPDQPVALSYIEPLPPVPTIRLVVGRKCTRKERHPKHA